MLEIVIGLIIVIGGILVMSAWQGSGLGGSYGIRIPPPPNPKTDGK